MNAPSSVPFRAGAPLLAIVVCTGFAYVAVTFIEAGSQGHAMVCCVLMFLSILLLRLIDNIAILGSLPPGPGRTR